MHNTFSINFPKKIGKIRYQYCGTVDIEILYLQSSNNLQYSQQKSNLIFTLVTFIILNNFNLFCI